MKKGVGILIGILFSLNIVLVVFIFLILTGVVDVRFGDNVSDNNEKAVIENNKDESKDYVFDVSYKDDVFEQKIGEGSLKNIRNLPVIKNDKHQDVADKIVSYLTDISDKNWKDVNKFNTDVTDFKYNIGVSYLFSTLVNNGEILSVDYKLNGSMGGVSWVGYWGYNFNPKTGDVLKITDVLVEEGTVELSDYVISEIEKEYDEESSLWQKDNSSGYWKDLAIENIFKEGTWFFTESGITVTFDKYLLGPGATGVVKIDIPKDTANMYLKEEYKF